MRGLALLGVLACGCSLMVPPGWDGTDGTTDAVDGADVPVDGSDGAVECTPDTRSCHGDRWEECNDAGDGWDLIQECDSGEVCVDSVGCVEETGCSVAASQHLHVGCEFWAVPLPIEDSFDAETFEFGVILSNVSDEVDARVWIYSGETLVVDGETVSRSSSRHIGLDLIPAQTHGMAAVPWNSLVMPEGAYYIVTDNPVAAWQTNPRHFDVGGTSSMHASATLLLPEHSITNSYHVLGLPPLSTNDTTGSAASKRASYISIVGTSDSTDVAVTVGGDTAAGSGVPATSGGGTINVNLGNAEVLHIASAVPADCDDERPGFMDLSDVWVCDETDLDPSGTIITATQPVAVFTGAVAVNVPYGVGTPDHVAEQVPPLETLGATFVTAPMFAEGATDVDSYVKILAVAPGTGITIDPDQDGIDNANLDEGQVFEFKLVSPAEITSTQPVLAAQFLVGKEYGAEDATVGDPAMTWLVPREQWSDSYTFEPPHEYDGGDNQMRVMIVREPTTTATLDRDDPGGWTSLASSRYSVTRVGVDAGMHFIEADGAVGVVMWGMGPDVGVACPVGTRLDPL